MVSSWGMAEQLGAQHVRELGFTGAQVTGAGADQGLDVVAFDAVAQVKYTSRPVGAPEIQRLRGAARGRENLIFYSISGYTAAAVREAYDVALFVYDEQCNVTPINDVAQFLAETADTKAERTRIEARARALLREYGAWSEAQHEEAERWRLALTESRRRKDPSVPETVRAHARNWEMWNAIVAAKADREGPGSVPERAIEVSDCISIRPYDMERARRLLSSMVTDLDDFKRRLVAHLGPDVAARARELLNYATSDASPRE